MAIRKFTTSTPQGVVQVVVGSDGKYATYIESKGVASGTFNDVEYLVRTLLGAGFEEEEI